MLPSISPYTLPYPLESSNRTSWEPNPARAVLLIHDMQEHFIQSYQRTESSHINQAISNIAKLRQLARHYEVPVIYTAQPPQQDHNDRQLLTDFWGPGLQDQAAAHIIQELEPLANETVLTKWRYCAFYRTDLEDRMRNHHKNQLWITGVCSHIGCLTTALTAFMHGFQVFFVADAQADFSLDYHLQALEHVSSRCGQVITTDQICQQASTLEVA